MIAEVVGQFKVGIFVRKVCKLEFTRNLS